MTLSAISIDQAHEQNNKVVKTDAIAILNDEDTLLEWEISGPSLSEIIKTFEYTNR